MRNNQGFTLIELLIVLVIIGVLTAIAVPQFSGARERAYYAAVKSDLRNLAAQQEIYYAGNFSYAGSLGDLGFVSSEGVTVTPSATATGWSATASHAALESDEGCALYYGEIEDPPSVGEVEPSAAGQVACTS